MSKIAKTLARGTVLAAVTGSVVSLAAAPAFAGPILLPAVGAPTFGPYNVTPACNSGPGVATNLNQITYTVYGTASSYSTNGALPVATGITCWIKDVYTKQVYGTISAALPGPEGAVAGTITVPFNSNPLLCGRGNALFNDNGTATTTTPGC